MFNILNIFTFESNIKKYKDEKSLQETGDVSILFTHINNNIQIKILFIFFIIVILISLYSSIAFCQDNGNINIMDTSNGTTVDNLHRMSDLEFSNWLKNASLIADQINTNSIRIKIPYIEAIKKINCILSKPNIINTRFNLPLISNEVLTNAKALVLDQNLNKFYFMQIPMNINNQAMPVEMYIDTLTHLVSDFNHDFLTINSFKNILINSNFNIDAITNQNLIELNGYQTSIKNNIFDLRQHSTSIDFDSLYGDAGGFSSGSDSD